MKVAVVHDWLVVNGGAEKVLENILSIYPNSELFTLVDFLPEKEREWLKGKTINTSFIQRLPFAKKHYRNYLPLFPIAVEQFDLSKFDLIISSSYSVAKGVISSPHQRHVCYCHSPARYAWDLQHQYLKESGLNKGLKSVITRFFLHRFRIWDVCSNNGVDKFIANSKFIQSRIMKCYRRDSEVIHPPVELKRFEYEPIKESFYLTASRLVPYKRIDLVVEAFSKLPNKKLIVVGDGPDMSKIKKLATHNIEIMGYLDNDKLVDLMKKARAFVFAAEEDFGIMPIEAQACGTPVIGLGKGGMLETIKHGITGIHFPNQDASSIISAINDFEKLEASISGEVIREHAESFSQESFKNSLIEVIERTNHV